MENPVGSATTDNTSMKFDKLLECILIYAAYRAWRADERCDARGADGCGSNAYRSGWWKCRYVPAFPAPSANPPRPAADGSQTNGAGHGDARGQGRAPRPPRS